MWASVAALVLVLSSWADAVPLTGTGVVVGQLGGRYDQGGGYVGLLSLGRDGLVCGTGHGMLFAGPTQVEYLTISQFWQDGGSTNPWVRQMIQSFDVYANGVRVGTATLDPTRDEQRVRILGLEGTKFAGQPIAVTATWVTLVQTSKYDPDPGYRADPYSTMNTFWFEGTPCAGPDPKETNLNYKRSVSAENDYGFGPRECVVDGNLLSHANNDSRFWQVTAGVEQSFTVTYGADDLQSVGSIGLSFLANHPDRNAPQWVIISDSNGHDIKVEMDPEQAQYNRYDRGWLLNADGEVVGDKMVLFADWFKDTASLKLTFPQWAGNDTLDGGNWWFGTGRSWFGLTEFQAFAGGIPKPSVALAVVPEPATMTLLALGGLAMLRRRT